MGVKSIARIHNIFRIVSRDAKTEEILEEFKAENIVLDRIYTRLLNYGTYFVNIVYGKGSGVPVATDPELFDKVGYKIAVEEELIRAYPTSKWTKSIRLGTNDANNTTLTEVGISETTTLINTHAMITDSVGQPLGVPKTELIIVDIYASVFIDLYDVDSGLFFYGDGLRDYLTGGPAPNNNLRISFLSEDDSATIAGTKTFDLAEKSITVAAKFDINDLNKDVKFIDWVGLGIRCVIPRLGVFESKTKTGVNIGTGDDAKTKFKIPNKFIKNISIKVDDVVNSDWTFDEVENEVVFNTAPAKPLLVTADYTCTLIPKDADHVLPISMKTAFAVTEPAPVVQDPDYSMLPGSNTLVGGNEKLGFYGEVDSVDLISGEDLCTAISLSDGILINSNTPWLRYAVGGNLIYVAKKAIRHSISWDSIHSAGAAYGERTIEINGNLFAVRLLSTGEWDKLMYPVHEDFGEWAQFTDEELLVHNSFGNGSYSWTSTPQGSNRIFRGIIGVTYSSYTGPSASTSYMGFRPVLTFLRAL